MAATFRPADALYYTKDMIKRMPLDRAAVGPQVLDQINKMIWMAAPWRWTIGTIAVGNLATDTQDYTITLPTDFLFLLDGYLADGLNPPRYLRAAPTFPTANVIVGQASQYALIPGTTNKIRIFPKPGTVNASPVTKITAYYKKAAPTVDEVNMDTEGLLEMDDEWFWVYLEGVLWKAYQYGDDQRAGNVNFDSAKGAWASTGQRAIFESALEYMRQREKLPEFDVRNAPEPIQTR